ncbi:MAG: carbohydrate ABC transporter permease [Oscillospiraceae bacterium]|nr:carbohydrate ABC transporter permease [Oscillospiraceae bacterium]MCL2279820.1 carbohydrate ABC transporter permease [Oscillospiraceae bacterium]
MMYKSDRIFNTIGHIFMSLLAFFVLVPFVLLLASSFTAEESLIRYGYNFVPREFSLFAYEWLFITNGAVIIRSYLMSFLVTAVGVVLSICITTPLAYGLAKRGLPMRKALTFFVFFTMIFNGGLVPTYINYTQVFGLGDTFWALVIPNLLTNGFFVLLMKSYFTTNIPTEILEAAEMDGAGEFRLMMQIAIPMAKPIIATVAIFVGINYWNDWINGFVYLVRRTDLFTIQNLLNRIMQNIQVLMQTADLGTQAAVGLARAPLTAIRMAMAVMGVLPIVLVYPFVQKNFVKGITLGGVKG